MPCPLDLGPTHKMSLPTHRLHAGTRGLWHLHGSTGVTQRYSAPSPDSCRDSGKSCAATSPHMCPHPPAPVPTRITWRGSSWPCVGESVAECWVCLGRTLPWVSNSSRTWVSAASVTSNFVLFLREILSKLRVEVQFDLRVTQLTEVVVGPKCGLELVWGGVCGVLCIRAARLQSRVLMNCEEGCYM